MRQLVFQSWIDHGAIYCTIVYIPCTITTT